MDRVLYLATSAAKQVLQAQTVATHNLANVNTVGFQADLAAFSERHVNGPGLDSRVYGVAEGVGTSSAKGVIQATGRPLDVAVNGDGWIAVQAPDGSEAYTRAGNLKVNINGQLTTGTGHPVLGGSGPLVVPEYEKLEIGADGTVSVRPIGQLPNTLAEVGRIKLVSPDPAELVKGPDGLLRMRNGDTAPASTEVTLMSGALEGSNVNGVEAMVNMIGFARQFEMAVQIMQSARQMDEQANKLMDLG